MLSRGTGLVVHRVQEGDRLHRRTGCRHRRRRRRLHSPGTGPSPGSSASTGLDPGFRAVIVVTVFSLACFIQCIFLCANLGGGSGQAAVGQQLADIRQVVLLQDLRIAEGAADET